ncbi:MAG: transporter substrate-binding domain-containing protein [Myxococcota bacterium]
MRDGADGPYRPKDERLLGKPELRIRVEDSDYAPFHVRNDAGELEGYSVGVMNELAFRLGRTPAYYPGPFPSAFQEVADGKYDVGSVDATYTLAREMRGLLFTGRPSTSEIDTLIVAKTAAATAIEDVLKDDQFKIAVQKGAATVALLANSHKVGRDRIVEVETSDDAVRLATERALKGEPYAVVTKMKVVEAVIGARAALNFKGLSGDIYDIIGGNRGPSLQVSQNNGALFAALQTALIEASDEGRFKPYGERYNVLTLSGAEAGKMPTTRQSDIDALLASKS